MSHTYPEPSPFTPSSAGAVLELLKPLTWFAPVWAFGCGAVSELEPLAGRGVELPDLARLALGAFVAGPMLCGASQAVNDWFDRHVDAVNEPDRPIPSGRLPGRSGLAVAIAWSALAIGFSSLLGPVVFAASLAGTALAWAYSAPPLRLKRDGWIGNAAVAVSYEGLAWVAGAALAAGGVPSRESLVLAALYSLGAHGIMTLNDFKSIEGDRRFGIRSLPARYGIRGASRMACAVMAGAQVAVLASLAAWGHAWAAAVIAALLVLQVAPMRRFLRSPRAEAARYNATGTLLYVLGMLVAAGALGLA